ncbi:MAG: hypothetical protein QNK35_09575 [Bacteroides sp.]|nr:hypothetical protein [Bacteroides sp.]
MIVFVSLELSNHSFQLSQAHWCEYSVVTYIFGPLILWYIAESLPAFLDVVPAFSMSHIVYFQLGF